MLIEYLRESIIIIIIKENLPIVINIVNNLNKLMRYIYTQKIIEYVERVQCLTNILYINENVIKKNYY